MEILEYSREKERGNSKHYKKVQSIKKFFINFLKKIKKT
jgi:hypothetical protein